MKAPVADEKLARQRSHSRDVTQCTHKLNEGCSTLRDMAECADDPEDDHTLKIEALEVVKEVAYAVSFVEISTVLPISKVLVYLNLRTKENENFCVELSVQGFRVS